MYVCVNPHEICYDLATNTMTQNFSNSVFLSLRNTPKRYNIMAFNAGDRVNCSTWTQVGFMSVCLDVTNSLSCVCHSIDFRVSKESKMTSSEITE